MLDFLRYREMSPAGRKIGDARHVKHEHQPGAAGVAQNSEQPGKKVHRPERVELALHASRTLDRCGDVGLSSEPSDQPFSQRIIGSKQRLAIGSQHSRKSWRGACDISEPALHQRLRGSGEGFAIGRIETALGNDVLFEGVEPGIYSRPQSALGRIGRCEPLDQAAVHLLPAMKRRLGLRDLDFTGGEARGPGALRQPTAEKCLTAAVFATHCLEAVAPRSHCGKIGIDGGFEAFHADCEGGKAFAGHRAASKSVEYCAAALRASYKRSSANWARSNVSSSTTSSPVDHENLRLVQIEDAPGGIDQPANANGRGRKRLG